MTISLKVCQELDRRLRVLAARLDLNRSEFIRRVLVEKLTHLPMDIGTNEAGRSLDRSRMYTSRAEE